MWIKSLARLCFGAALLASALHAQTAGTGTLVGTITDNSGRRHERRQSLGRKHRNIVYV